MNIFTLPKSLHSRLKPVGGCEFIVGGQAMKWKKNEAQNSEARIEKLVDEVRKRLCGSW